MGELEDPPIWHEGEDDDDDASDGWDEMEVTGEQTTCLFCPSQFLTIAVALDHCRTEHNFDLSQLKTKYSMDCYSFLKMVNYVRLHRPDAKTVAESGASLWEDEVYLKPGEMESWLMYDFDDLGSTPSTPHCIIDQKVSITKDPLDLQRQIQQLTLELQHKDALLKDAARDMEKMRELTKSLVDDDGNVTAIDVTVGSRPLNCDNSYFGSYSHYGIHHEMLNDKVRTSSYRDAILKNSDVFATKTVLDVGCGTAILSMFAAKAGAVQVYGIDQSDVVYKAMDIVRENKLDDKISLIHGRIENTALPVQKVDIIISEWMGYFLLFEGMLDSFIYARDRYLNTNGTVLPNRCSMHLLGLGDVERHNGLIDYWDDVYGFKMQCMKSEVVREANIDTVDSAKAITTTAQLNEIDLYTCKSTAVDFTSRFQLTVTQDGALTAFVGYFDTFFDLDDPVSFSTAPTSAKTHWQQTIFHLRHVREVKQGNVIEGTLECRRLKGNARGLSIVISMGTDKFEYILD